MTAFFDWLDWALAAYALQLVGLFALVMTIWALRLRRRLDLAHGKIEYWRKWAQFYHDRYQAMKHAPPPSAHDPDPAGYEIAIDLQDAYRYEIDLHEIRCKEGRAPRHKMPVAERIPVCHIEMDGHIINTFHWN